MRDLKVLVVSTWPPKPCGIATFSQALMAGILARHPTNDHRVVAIDDPGDRFAYPAVVRHHFEREDLAGLRRATAYINAAGADVVLLQHEFGIWGGFDGEFILRFLDRLQVPVVAICHAVPVTETTFSRENRLWLLAEIGRRVAQVVTFLPVARAMLVNELGLPAERVTVIPHGAPAFDRSRRPAARARLGVDDRLVMTTFGLLSRFKGIADVLAALPALVADAPQLLYLVLGQPHPYEPPEFYPGLRALVERLGLSDHVRFVDRFLSDDELEEALVATDLYITPYHDLAQISSGTLAFALSAGCCCVATPYLYAQTALADDRGVFIPAGNPAGLAAVVRPLLTDAERRARYAAAAAAYGATLHWPHVAGQYLAVLNAVARPTRRLLTLPANHG